MKHKIETYFIPPIKNVRIMSEGDRLFALANLVVRKNRAYYEYFRINKGFVTIDSGVAEGARVDMHRIIECAKLVRADEIICPDELYNGEVTIKLTTNFINSLTKYQKEDYLFMMVPQGKTLQEFVTCLDILQKIPECTCIGISKFSAVAIFGQKNDKHKVMSSRQRLIDYLHKHKLIKKPIHCLGYDNPKEFEHYIRKKYNFIRSCDSASAILCGIKGIKFNKENGIDVEKPIGGNKYHNLIIQPSQYNIINHNIAIVKYFCGQ